VSTTGVVDTKQEAGAPKRRQYSEASKPIGGLARLRASLSDSASRSGPLAPLFRSNLHCGAAVPSCGVCHPLRCRWADLPFGFGGSFGDEITDIFEQSRRALVSQNVPLDRSLRQRPQNWGRE
jgi:hypothetical protein